VGSTFRRTKHTLTWNDGRIWSLALVPLYVANANGMISSFSILTSFVVHLHLKLSSLN
jgi:hypothetical protein